MLMRVARGKAIDSNLLFIVDECEPETLINYNYMSYPSISTLLCPAFLRSVDSSKNVCLKNMGAQAKME